MILWMAYAALVGGLVASAGWAAERLAVGGGVPRRFVWLAAILMSVGVPLVARPASGLIDLTEAPAPVASQSPPVRANPPTPQATWWDGVALTAWTAASSLGLVLMGLVLGGVHFARRRWDKGRIGHTEVYLSERFGPALVGVTRPVIVIPTWVSRLEAKAAAIIVGHEEEHRRAGDQLTLLVGGALTALFPWNPAVWWMARRLRAAVEIDCDGRLLAKGIRPAEYGEVLLHVSARPRTSWGPLPAMAEPKSLLERRLKTMGESQGKMTTKARAVLTALAAMLLFTAFEVPAPTGVRNALDRAIGAQRAGAQEVDTSTIRVGNLTFEGDTLIIDDIRIVVPGTEPLIFVNNELINPEGQDESVLQTIDRDQIERIEVIKGVRAREAFGPRGVASGVVQIYMKGYEPPHRSPPADRISERALEEQARELALSARQTERAVEEQYEAVRERLLESERALAAEVEGALLERAREQADARAQLGRLQSIQNSAALEARIEALSRELEQLERRKEELERQRKIGEEPPARQR